MLDNMTTGEKVIAGATAVGIAALIFHKPTRNAVGLADGRRKKGRERARKNMAFNNRIIRKTRGEYLEWGTKPPKMKVIDEMMPKKIDGSRVVKTVYEDGEPSMFYTIKEYKRKSNPRRIKRKKITQ